MENVVKIRDAQKKNDEDPNVALPKLNSVNYSTNYLETLMHLLKGNIGPGIFAMGDAFKNSGMVVGLILVPFLSITCVHTQHLLINKSKYIKEKLKLENDPDYATTVEQCFLVALPNFKKIAACMKGLTNFFLCFKQLGYCCVYFVFISTNIEQVLNYYGFAISLHYLMAIILIPILLSCLILNLKYLAPLSTIANIVTFTSIAITLYYCCQEPYEHVDAVAGWREVPLFFGTMLYAYQGIGLVLPLQNQMKRPHKFSKILGVLNIGMTMVTVLFMLVGAFGYLKYGHNVQGSITLNLPKEEKLAQTVKVVISLGVLFTFALQFYVPIEIMYPSAKKHCHLLGKPVIGEAVFRTFFVLLTFTVAEVIPYLDLFISFIGALCATAVGLLFPPIIDIIALSDTNEFKHVTITKNCFIIGIGLLGCIVGSWESIRLIIKAFSVDS